MTPQVVFCDMGVGCEESGVCYAVAHGEPGRCGLRPLLAGNVIPLRLADNAPAHKQTDPNKAPGQIVNPIPEALLYKPAHGGYPSPSKDQA